MSLKGRVIKQRPDRLHYNVGRKWTPEEDGYLLEHAHDPDDAATAVRMNRTVLSVAHRRYDLGITTPEQYMKKWSAEEEALLREHIPTRPIEEILPLFPERTRKQVWVKADRMGLTGPGQYPKELRDLIRLANRLKRKIHERETEHR